MNHLARLLRWLADKCGGETDLDLRARVYNVVRNGRPADGTQATVERAIKESIPAYIHPEFKWSREGRDEVLMVRFR